MAEGGYEVRQDLQRGGIKDQFARDIAIEAQHGLDAHKDVCAERWKNAADAMKRIEESLTSYKTQVREVLEAKDELFKREVVGLGSTVTKIELAVNGLYRRFWFVAWSLIVGMASLIVLLVWKV